MRHGTVRFASPRLAPRSRSPGPARLASPFGTQHGLHATPHLFWLLVGVTLAVALLLLVAAPAGTAPVRAAPSSPALERVAFISDGALSGRAVFSPSEMQFAAVTTDGDVRLMQPSGTVLRVLKRRPERITTVAYSPDGRYLLAGTESGKGIVFDLRSDAQRVVFDRPGTRATCVFWLPNPDRAVLASHVSLRDVPATPALFIYDLATGRALGSYHSFVQDGFDTLCPSADGASLAALGVPDEHGAASLLNVSDGKVTARFADPDHPGGWLSVCLSPDGKSLATGHAADIVLWDLASGRRAGVLKGHQGWVVALAFSPDGRRLASGSYDGTARVWDMATGREIGHIAFGDGDGSVKVRSVSFSPDGSLLLAATWADHIVARIPAP